MSTMAVLKLDDAILLASDSHSTRCNGETDRQYKKLFPFSNGVFGVIGVNNILIEGENINLGEYIQKTLIKDKQITSNQIYKLLKDFYKEKYESLTQTAIEIVFIFAENDDVCHEYYSISQNHFIYDCFVKMPERHTHIYAFNAITFPKGNTEFMNEINRNPIEAIKRVIRFNSDMQLFVENARYVGGAIQMYKVLKDGEVENLSEEPFS